MTRRFLGFCSLAFAIAVLSPGQAAPGTPRRRRAAVGEGPQGGREPGARRRRDPRALRVARGGSHAAALTRAGRSGDRAGDAVRARRSRQGSAIDFVLAAPLTAAVPPIVGRTQEDAVGRLRRAGLVAGEVSLQESRSPRGLVLSQRPPAGQVVAAGTAVDMTVATPVTVRVPAAPGPDAGRRDWPAEEGRARARRRDVPGVPQGRGHRPVAGAPGGSQRGDWHGREPGHGPARDGPRALARRAHAGGRERAAEEGRADTRRGVVAESRRRAAPSFRRFPPRNSASSSAPAWISWWPGR